MYVLSSPREALAMKERLCMWRELSPRERFCHTHCNSWSTAFSPLCREVYIHASLPNNGTTLQKLEIYSGHHAQCHVCIISLSPSFSVPPLPPSFPLPLHSPSLSPSSYPPSFPPFLHLSHSQGRQLKRILGPVAVVPLPSQTRGQGAGTGTLESDQNQHQCHCWNALMS